MPVHSRRRIVRFPTSPSRYALRYHKTDNNQCQMLILADRRAQQLYTKLPSNIFKVLHFLGATFERMLTECRRHILTLRPKYLVILGGLCDMTVLDRTTRLVKLRHTDSDNLVNHMHQQVVQATELAKQFFPEMKIIFGEVCGIDIDTYNRRNGLDDPHVVLAAISQQFHQTVLNASIEKINNIIRQHNRRNRVPHPRFARKLHVVSSGRLTSHRYRLLHNGITPQPVILSDWARQIRQIYKRLERV